MKHGDSPNCGYDYVETNYRASCPACGCDLSTTLPDWPHKTLVRHTRKAARSIYGNGARGCPIDGVVIGSTGSWPIVLWSNGDVMPIAAEALERKKGKVF